MKINIEKIPAYNIAYASRTGEYGADNIQVMEKLKKWAKENNLMNGNAVILAIIHDNPQITAPEKCRYNAGIVIVNKNQIENDGVEYGKITGGKYAIFTIEHTVKSMAEVWGNMFPMLSKNKNVPDSTRPIMERYSEEKVEQHLCEICVPII